MVHRALLVLQQFLDSLPVAERDALEQLVHTPETVRAIYLLR